MDIDSFASINPNPVVDVLSDQKHPWQDFLSVRQNTRNLRIILESLMWTFGCQMQFSPDTVIIIPHYISHHSE